MGKTYSCDVDGCDMVFSRDFKLRKHKVEHEDSNRLSYCEWPGCDFYTLDPRRLVVHFATHTGEKIRGCPDKIQVLGPSRLVEQEPCKYVTNDPSMLTKHRKKAHGYVPHPRARSKNTGNYEFVPYNTSDATSRPRKTKRARKPKTAVQSSKSARVCTDDKTKLPTDHGEDTTLDGSSPSTSQQGADEYEQPNVASPDAAGISSQAVDFTNNTFEYMAASNPQALDTASSNNPTSALVAPVTWDHESLGSVELQHMISPDTGNTTPFTLFQGDVPFDPTTNFHWPTFYMEGFGSHSTAGTYDPASYNPAPCNSARNSEMGSFEGLRWDSLEDLVRL